MKNKAKANKIIVKNKILNEINFYKNYKNNKHNLYTHIFLFFQFIKYWSNLTTWVAFEFLFIKTSALALWLSSKLGLMPFLFFFRK